MTHKILIFIAYYLVTLPTSFAMYAPTAVAVPGALPVAVPILAPAHVLVGPGYTLPSAGTTAYAKQPYICLHLSADSEELVHYIVNAIAKHIHCLIGDGLSNSRNIYALYKDGDTDVFTAKEHTRRGEHQPYHCSLVSTGQVDAIVEGLKTALNDQNVKIISLRKMGSYLALVIDMDNLILDPEQRRLITSLEPDKPYVPHISIIKLMGVGGATNYRDMVLYNIKNIPIEVLQDRAFEYSPKKLKNIKKSRKLLESAPIKIIGNARSVEEVINTLIQYFTLDLSEIDAPIEELLFKRPPEEIKSTCESYLRAICDNIAEKFITVDHFIENVGIYIEYYPAYLTKENLKNFHKPTIGSQALELYESLGVLMEMSADTSSSSNNCLDDFDVFGGDFSNISTGSFKNSCVHNLIDFGFKYYQYIDGNLVKQYKYLLTEAFEDHFFEHDDHDEIFKLVKAFFESGAYHEDLLANYFIADSDTFIAKVVLSGSKTISASKRLYMLNVYSQKLLEVVLRKSSAKKVCKKLNQDNIDEIADYVSSELVKLTSKGQNVITFSRPQ